MDFWMIARRVLKNDLLDIFTALDDLQYRYDWVISDTDIYFAPDTPDEVRKRWSWNSLLIDGRELAEHLSAGYVHFESGGVLSAVSKGTQPSQMWDYVPCWEIEGFGSSDYHFQTPLTKLELLCYDGYVWVIICEPGLSENILRALPQAKTPEEFYNESE